jgi:hypothetical protein
VVLQCSSGQVCAVTSRGLSELSFSTILLPDIGGKTSVQPGVGKDNNRGGSREESEPHNRRQARSRDARYQQEREARQKRDPPEASNSVQNLLTRCRLATL